MDNLQKIYRDICKGYSSDYWENTPIYIKHFDNFDQSDIDDFYEKELEKSIKIGIPTKEEKLNWLVENELWNNENEKLLIEQKDYVENMERTKEKLMLKIQIDAHNKVLNEEKKKYIEMIQKKDKLFGLTAENRTTQKMQYFYIYLSLFEDKNLKNKLFTINQINDMYDDESYKLLEFYAKFIEKFNINNIKKISVSNFFINHFYLCGDDIFNFFSIPFFNLTIYQSNLLSYGLYFKNLMANEQIPKEIKDDPEKIEEYINKSKNMKDLISKTGSEGGRTGVVGATKEDFKLLNIKNDTKFIKDVTKQGVSNINDAIKMV